jgi:hypothetical protein
VFLCGALAVFFSVLTPAATLHSEPTDSALQRAALARSIELESEHTVPPGTRIRSIYISTDEVFEVDKNFAFTFANALHWTTKESTVRRELLYKEGDEYRQDLIDESERILRGIGLFTVERTRVVPVEEEEGLVDIYIDTQDVWSLYFNVKGGYSGEIFTYVFMVGERNLFGRGISFEVRFDRDNFLTRWGQHFEEPRLFGSHWRFFERAGIYYDDEGNHAGEGVELLLERPLFARSERWGWRTAFVYENTPVIKHKGGEIDTVIMGDGTALDRRYHSKYFIFENRLIRSFGYTNKLNVGLYIRNEHYSYTAHDDVGTYESEFRNKVMKDDYTRHKAGVLLEANNHRWARIRDFDRYGVIEDFPQGSSARVTLSTSQKIWASDENAAYLNVMLSNNTILGGGKQILRPSVGFRSDFVAGQEARNKITSLRYHHHFRAFPLGTLSLRAEGSIGENLDNETYFTLGADTGLRGYVSDRFEGDRRVLLSAEYRFNPIPFFFKSHLAFVVFTDVGSCWYNDGRNARDRRLYPGAGIGLRFGMPSVNPDLWRLDFATNFGNESRSFGSIFSLNFGQTF